jgi:NADPH-dependent 2,4-dienoyl-CoA reductase/sulfur reductase-like enzyme
MLVPLPFTLVSWRLICRQVLAIDPAGHTVAVRELATGRGYHEAYDALVLSTGAAPVIPPVPGAGLPAVRVLRTVPRCGRLGAMVAGGARRAVIVGAGFIGLESAEALRHRGLAVTLVELAGQVMPALDPEMARSIELELLRAGVAVRLGTSVTALREAGGGTVAADLSDGSQVLADLVLLAAGVRPETSLAAAAAGLALGARGALLVDEHLRTSVPSIYGVGDAIEVTDAVTGGPALVPLAGPASRQGRAVADHLFGGGGRRSPVLGTAIVRVFGTVAATTGPSEKALRAAGIPHHAVHLHPDNHAGYYPGARPLHLKLLFAPDGRVLGAQATGGDGVDKRIDVIAAATRAGLTVYDLADRTRSAPRPGGYLVLGTHSVRPRAA